MPAKAALNARLSVPQGPNDLQHFFQTRDPGKKSPDAAAQTELKIYPSLTLA